MIKKQTAYDDLTARLQELFREADSQLPSGDTAPDNERIHQYRVSIRRIRALLGQLPGVFEPESVDRVRTRLRGLMQTSNLVRDLDVLSESWPDLAGDLPESCAEALTGLRQRLMAQRNRARKRWLAELASPEYQSQWAGLLTLVNEKDLPPGDLAGKRSQKLIRQAIRQRYRKLCKHLAVVDAFSPPDELHRVRIDIKKLRYCSELLPVGEDKGVEGCLNSLRKAQNRLGEFNDVCQQLVWLQSQTEAVERRRSLTFAKEGQLMFCLGALQYKLEQRAQKLQQRSFVALQRVRLPETILG